MQTIEISETHSKAIEDCIENLSKPHKEPAREALYQALGSAVGVIVKENGFQYHASFREVVTDGKKTAMCSILVVCESYRLAFIP